MKRAKSSCAAAIVLLTWACALAPLGDAQAANDFRFAILGDRTGDADKAVYAEIWDEMSREHPDFVINVGDSIQGGNDATAQTEWRELRRLWDRYKLPLYFTPGNHDIWSETSRRIYETETGRRSPYGFDFQNAHFTILDNSDGLNLSDRQMRFLEHDLEQNKDRSPKFVFFHEPFWLIPLKFGSGAFPFHQLALKYGVSYVVSGHGHQFVRLVRDGVTYVEAGSSGGRLKGQGFANGWFYLHALAWVKGPQVEITVHEVGPPFGQGRAFDAIDWGEHGPKFKTESPAPKR